MIAPGYCEKKCRTFTDFSSVKVRFFFAPKGGICYMLYAICYMVYVVIDKIYKRIAIGLDHRLSAATTRSASTSAAAVGRATPSPTPIASAPSPITPKWPKEERKHSSHLLMLLSCYNICTKIESGASKPPFDKGGELIVTLRFYCLVNRCNRNANHLLNAPNQCRGGSPRPPAATAHLTTEPLNSCGAPP